MIGVTHDCEADCREHRSRSNRFGENILWRHTRVTVVMDMGWIVTFAADQSVAPQISIATEGGSGTPVPDLSIEVDDLPDVHQRILVAGFRVQYGPVTEPWGVTRFYVRDPFGRLVNVLAHEQPAR
jgi:catechol 2,3-dioxygenase-like lactoylglutathione lyase family enzyme